MRLKLTFIGSSFVGIMLLLLYGCMRDVNMTVLKPAHVAIPRSIDTLVVVNRTKAKKGGDEVLDVLEGVITGEGVFADREGSRKAVKGIMDRLGQSPRFEVVQSNQELRGKNVNRLPPPLDWKKVRDICQESGADAVIALELIDSDMGFSVDESDVLVNAGDGETEGVEVTRTLWVKSGWRVYDPDKQEILDEYTNKLKDEEEEKAVSEDDALSRFSGNRDAILDLCYKAGRDYANRISPNWQVVDREYYKSGNDLLDRADIEAQKDNWEKAGQLWKKSYRKARKRKILKRSSYNIALIMEIEGKLDSALYWAKRSAYNHGLNRAEDYVDVLEYRKRERQAVNQQMKP